MPVDALAVLQALTTRTATLNSTGYNLKGGTPRRGLFARIIYKNANTTSGAGAATFRITESSDDSTYAGIHQTPDSVLTLGTTAISGEIFIPISTSKPYIRSELSAISGTGATVDFQVELTLGRP